MTVESVHVKAAYPHSDCRHEWVEASVDFAVDPELLANERIRNAAMSPPNTMTSTASETGNAILSLTTRSFLTFARISCWTPRVPPARAATFGSAGGAATNCFAVSAASSAVPSRGSSWITRLAVVPKFWSRISAACVDSEDGAL